MPVVMGWMSNKKYQDAFLPAFTLDDEEPDG